MLRVWVILMAGMLVLGIGSACYAAGEEAEQHATAATKLGNGLGNMLTGWMEIPRKISEVSSEQDAFAGITIGTLTGACYGTGRTAAGVLDAGTFVFPPYDKPIMEPVYHF